MSDIHDPFGFTELKTKDPQVIGLFRYIWLYLTDKSFREFMRDKNE